MGNGKGDNNTNTYIFVHFYVLDLWHMLNRDGKPNVLNLSVVSFLFNSHGVFFLKQNRRLC